MAFQLGEIKEAYEKRQYEVLELIDPEELRHFYKRRVKGKLYKTFINETTKLWLKEFSSLATIGSFARYQNSKSGKWNQSELIPEHTIVLYLGGYNKAAAKVLWKQRIYLIPRGHLTLEPISS